jgi:hypothetical protein
MVIRRHSGQPWKHTIWTYRRCALTHYVQIAPIVAAVVFGALTLSIAFAALLLIGGALLGVLLLPNLAVFRQSVDDRLLRDAQARAVTARAALVIRMSAEHRREFERLEDLMSRVRAATAMEQAGHDEWLGLDGLLALYVRLAIAHQENAAAFEATTDVDLDMSIASLSAPSANADVAARDAERLAILRDRQETRRFAREERALIAAELSSISETVRWTYEQCALGRSSEAHSGVVDAIAQCRGHGQLLRELAALGSQGPIDSEVLRLGWAGTNVPPCVATYGAPCGPPYIGPMVAPTAPPPQVRVDCPVEHAPSAPVEEQGVVLQADDGSLQFLPPRNHIVSAAE